jgi:hypothetical protein
MRRFLRPTSPEAGNDLMTLFNGWSHRAPARTHRDSFAMPAKLQLAGFGYTADRLNRKLTNMNVIFDAPVFTSQSPIRQVLLEPRRTISGIAVE